MIRASYRQNSMTFVDRSLKMGRAIGLSEKALAARLEIAQQGMYSEMENNCTNVSVLLQQHAKQCKFLFENGLKSFADQLDRIEAEALRRQKR
jgi:hypothetical protein